MQNLRHKKPLANLCKGRIKLSNKVDYTMNEIKVKRLFDEIISLAKNASVKYDEPLSK